MKNIIIAVVLAVLVGAGVYFFKASSHHDGSDQQEHSHDGGEPHAH